MPGVLTDAEIAEFRGLVETLAMPDSFSIVRDTEVPDGAGGFTTTETTVASGDCRLRAGGLQPNERALAERLGWVVAYAVDLPYDIIITPSDRLMVNGRTFEVGGVVDSGVWAMTKVVIAREVG